MSRITARRKVTRVRVGRENVARADLLAVEEPLEIRIASRPLMVTMRTPGNDVELVSGLLVAEGVVRAPDDIISARYCAGTDAAGRNTYNVLDVELTAAARARADGLTRTVATTSACGVCGASSIDAVIAKGGVSVADDPLVVDADIILSLPDRLRDHQAVFAKTGGLHAAGLFDGTGRLLVVREDVGRHNAVDKVIGWALAQQMLPLAGNVIQVSGRASFELVQKATMAGIPMMSAVSAPSSLAAELAEDRGMTLFGFVRGESLVVYTRADRLRCQVAEHA